MKDTEKGGLKGIGKIALFVIILAVIFVVVTLLAVADRGRERRKQREERLAKQREEFRADMKTYFGLEESDYAIVSEESDSSNECHLCFTCGGQNYIYSNRCTDYKAEVFREEARSWFEGVIAKTEWFAGMETEILKIGNGVEYLSQYENLIPLTYFKGTLDSFFSELLSEDGRRKDYLNNFYMTCEVQITASEVPDSAGALLQLKDSIPCLKTLIVHCYRVDPETGEKVFVKKYSVDYASREVAVNE